MNYSKNFLFSLVIASLLVPAGAFAKIDSVDITITGYNNSLIRTIDFPLENFAGGVDVMTADLGDDGVREILVANGYGNEPRVTVLRQDGSEIGSFLAYDESMKSGITVATCDLNDDGIEEILTGTQFGAGPHVRAFTNYGELFDGGFFAYNEGFRGGVNIACGDYDSDGIDEVITGAGPGGGPHVKIWGYSDGGWTLEAERFVFEPDDTRGVLVFYSEGILASSQIGETRETFAFDKDLVAREHITSTTTGMGSVSQDRADLDYNEIYEMLSAPHRPQGFYDHERYALVDLSDQQLYAFENGVMVNTFPISAGLYPWATPVGVHSVLAKLPYVDYSWNYGVDNPNNYSLGLVPWNLRIYPHIYIHYAYWHDNFGEPMSHGCVNASLENMIWVYNWADVGVPVEVRE